MLTTEMCIEKFAEDYSARLSKSIIEVYKIAIKQMIRFCEKPYYEILIQDVRSWLRYLDANGYKKSSIKTKMFGLRLFYKYCIEEGYMKHNPIEAIPLPKDDDKLPYYLTNEQLNQLRSLCEGNVMLRAIIEVFYTTGVRLRELTNMKLEDINWAERTIRIPRGKGKKERVVVFTKGCEEYVKAYLATRIDKRPFLFINRYGTEPVHPASIENWLKSFHEEMGFPLTPHMLRHTFAAHLAMKGMKFEYIQALLGHDNPKHTQIYTRLYQEAQKQKYDQWM